MRLIPTNDCDTGWFLNPGRIGNGVGTLGTSSWFSHGHQEAKVQTS
jgi:hypothetical protein